MRMKAVAADPQQTESRSYDETAERTSRISSIRAIWLSVSSRRSPKSSRKNSSSSPHCCMASSQSITSTSSKSDILFRCVLFCFDSKDRLLKDSLVRKRLRIVGRKRERFCFPSCVYWCFALYHHELSIAEFETCNQY